MIAMKEKDMLKNMYEQEHGSKALDMSADEILTANLSKGARVRSRGFAGAAIAAAAMLAVGVGAFALHTGLETADSGVGTPVAASNLSSSQQKPESEPTQTDGQPLTAITRDEYSQKLYKDSTMYVFCDDKNADEPDFYIVNEEYVSEIKDFISKYLNGEVDCEGCDYKFFDRDETQSEEITQFTNNREFEKYDGYFYQVIKYRDENGKYISIETAGTDYSNINNLYADVSVYDEYSKKPDYLIKSKRFLFTEQSDLSKMMTALWNNTLDYRAKLGVKSADDSSDEKTTTTVTQKTPDSKSTERAAQKPDDNKSDEPAVTTTVTYDPKNDYTPDEIQPLPRGEIDFADKPVIVRFTRSVDSSLPQADMSFRLIDWYEDIVKDMYDEYKSGNIKPAATLTMDDEPEGITGGTAMTVYWTRDDGGLVEFMGVDMDGQKAYIRLTDLDENDTCATGKVHYFSTDSEMYQMLWKIWDFYYPVYENVDEMP